MIYHRTHAFKKALRKLNKEKSGAVANALRIFDKNPFDPRLQNHKLKGERKGSRAFSTGFDLRVIYQEEGNHAVILLIKVGSHEEVYE